VNLRLFFLSMVLFVGCSSSSNELEIYDFQGVKKFLEPNGNKTTVVNFWATWCAPCVKELPYFETIRTQYPDEVDVLLISLDFPNQIETKLKPFLKDKQLKSKVVVLDDVDMNAWIPQIDPNWDGAIPVTLIFNEKKRQFYPQSFTYEQLVIEIEHFIN